MLRPTTKIMIFWFQKTLKCLYPEKKSNFTQNKKKIILPYDFIKISRTRWNTKEYEPLMIRKKVPKLKEHSFLYKYTKFVRTPPFLVYKNEVCADMCTKIELFF